MHEKVDEAAKDGDQRVVAEQDADGAVPRRPARGACHDQPVGAHERARKRCKERRKERSEGKRKRREGKRERERT